MKHSTTKYQRTLQQRIDSVLAVNPVKIQKLEAGSIRVNDDIIYTKHNVWHYRDITFYRRKSAVGYAVAMLSNDRETAKRIQTLDQQVMKYKTDLDHYWYHLKRSKPRSVNYTIMSNRISSDLPHLHQVDKQLTTLLKTVSF